MPGRAKCKFQKKNRKFTAKISPVSDKSSLVGAFCVIEDSTDRENLLSQMWSVQELSKEYDAIFNSCSEGLWVCDADANVIRINESSEKINKISGDDVIGRNMRDLVTEGFIDRSGTLEVLKSKSTIHLIQYTRDGMKLMITAKPVYDEQGRLFKVVVTEKDITEIETLHLELKEQTAIRDQFRTQMLEMQLAELESRRIIARSPCFVNVLQQAMKVSTVDSTVLILGESGCGKGLLAELIHKYSHRADRPMIKINCGAIPESLVESELFGYDRGAFTGAHKDGKPGYFELANNGILLLDEIVELPMSSQVKLLRFLEDSHITRVGGTVSRKLNIRVLAATNRDLVTAVANRDFRLDLFYRLNVIPIKIPPLRERRECILPMVHHYVEHFSKKLGIKKRLRFSSKASDALLAYSYPGNVRELMNLCERLVVMSEKNRIDLTDLPTTFLAEIKPEHTQPPAVQDGRSLQEILEAAEASAISSAMKTFGTQSKASRVLGVNQSTIARKLKKYGLTEHYT
jgi:PAS domain S-box-containing protein